LDDPDRAERGLEDRHNAYNLVDDRFLKVTYVHEEEDIVVITVIEKEGVGI
jgi:hypothetical protein